MVCLKHQAAEQYAALRQQLFVMNCVTDPLANRVWNIILDNHQIAVGAAWKVHSENVCTCWDVETRRMGGSWASQLAADVANLEDVAD